MPDMFELLVFRESSRTELATVTRLSESAPLRCCGVVAEIVQPHRAVPHRAHHTFAPRRVGRTNARRETVFRVIAETDGLGFGCESLHGQDRSEGLLTDDPHRSVTPIEDCRQVETAFGKRRVGRPR